LLEGSILRAGLAKDIRLFDGYPGGYAAWLLRLHRWTRGDWQLLPWLFRRVRNRKGAKTRNPINALSKWKIADNLRRSLLYPAYWLAVLIALFLPGAGWLWIGLTLLAAFLPALLSLPGICAQKARWRRFASGPGRAAEFLQNAALWAVLPHLAFSLLDAVARTLWRLAFSKKDLLQWVPAAEQERGLKNDFPAFLRRLGPALALSFAVCILAAWLVNPWPVLPLALLFALGPWPVWRMGQARQESPGLDQQAKDELKGIAKKVWEFYRDFAGAQEHFLPPDNVQIEPPNGVARRTSPTNIGFLLAALVIAREFGFIESGELRQRAERVLDSIERLEKWRGHLYNWYNTASGRVMRPRFVSTVDSGNLAVCLLLLAEGLKKHGGGEAAFLTLAEKAENMALAMDFGVLYDKKRRLFSVGWQGETERLANSYYDLLASEARLAVYFAVARGQVPQEEWFRLSRPLTSFKRYVGLLSWSGTMFEYLMPQLFLPAARGGLLDESVRFAIFVQMAQGERDGLPWGVSESGFHHYDLQLNYQYKAFGSPLLALERQRLKEKVVAPYASFLALPVAPQAAWKNIQRLKEEGAVGEYGFYEAVDYTPGREGVVKSFMAHHQGMILAGIANLLTPGLPALLQNNALIRAGAALLQERMASDTVVIKKEQGVKEEKPRPSTPAERPVMSYGSSKANGRAAHVLSGGDYHIFLTNDGEGSSAKGGLVLNRWRPYGGKRGFFISVASVDGRELFSPTACPSGWQADSYEAQFALDRAVFNAAFGENHTQLTVAVLPDEAGELRRLVISNAGKTDKILEVTAWLEPTLSAPGVDELHMAFSNLFIETSFYAAANCLICRRRSRKQEDGEPWLAFGMAVAEKDAAGALEVETSRQNFYGRGGSAEAPAALCEARAFSGALGAVLDPVLALRRRIIVPAGGRAACDFFLLTAAGEAELTALADKYGKPEMMPKALEMALIRSKVEMGWLQMSKEEILEAWELGRHLFFERRPSPQAARNTLGQAALWGEGISGDRPLVLAHIRCEEESRLFARLLRINDYWRAKGRPFELLAVCYEEPGYYQPLLRLLRQQVASAPAEKSGVFLRQAHSLPEALLNLFSVIAAAEFSGAAGSLSKQLALLRENAREEPMPLLPCVCAAGESGETPMQGEFFNDYGSFSEDGREYRIYLREGRHTPAPWTNLLTNGRFGTLVSESGLGYSWHKNSRENKISPWYNDPLEPEAGEAFFLADAQSGAVLGPMPLPARGGGEYEIRHGWGYSVWRRLCGGVEQELSVHVDSREAVKICRLKVKNRGGQKRLLRVNYAFTPVLAVLPGCPGLSARAERGLLLFGNGYNTAYQNQAVFLASSLKADVLDAQKALYAAELALEAGESREIVFCLGAAESEEEAFALAQRFCLAEEAKKSFEETKEWWLKRVSGLQLQSHERALDMLFNGWLNYQTIAYRLLGRAGFYQCGGAFGFRDQLQDVLCLLPTLPELAREQILLHAGRQFPEGDVLHWWHEEEKVRGVRTRITDDLLWLPYVTAEYLLVSGDESILDEKACFVEGPPLAQGEHEHYGALGISGEATLYEHCCLAIERALQFGPRGLPLMGGGDWNDGMNLVGVRGQGESVWLGWFIPAILRKFLPYMRRRGDEERARRWEELGKAIIEAVEREGWDGAWYRRAYSDEGVALGSAAAEECRIDSLSQTWAVFCGEGDGERARLAMEQAKKHLWRREEGVFLLLAPPFDKWEIDPGYIRGYVPGV
ncbi:MAG: hypothetical protein FWE85_03030, partial [Clostridiales bacterium]|nr:hypothetical protein [Clostridiales bacterium]